MMADAQWQDNTGQPPIFIPDYEGEPCPAHLFTEDEAANGRVFVRLRKGAESKSSWPVRRGTRWTLTGDDHDIEKWRKA